MLWFLVIPIVLVHHLTINLYLINKRADEVMSYLIFKGIPRNVISLQDRGEEIQ